MFQCRFVDAVVLVLGSVVVSDCVVIDDLLCQIVFFEQPRGSRIDNPANYDRSICFRWSAQVESG